MTPAATNLCRHYADLLRASGRSERSIDNSLYWLKDFTRFLGERRLDQVTADDIVAYQVDVAARGKSDSCVRVATYTLRGFYHHVLGRNDWSEARLPRPRRPKHLPEVLSSEEVEAILAAAPNLKYRTAFMLCYGAGLRTSEVVHLEPRHVDSQRMVLRVERGKGNKDRQVVLSQRLLTGLRECWRHYRPERFLLEGKRRGQPIDPTRTQRAFRDASLKAGITKPVTPRSLRHAFATHPVEVGIDSQAQPREAGSARGHARASGNLRVVQSLLGHQSLNTTAVYTHLAKGWLQDVKSPLDRLKESKPAV